MLRRILSEADCAECRLCCGFYESEIWEVPLIDDELAEKYPEYDFKAVNYDENGLHKCPALGESGCKLGSDKPFDCRLWPFRAMKLGEHLVIAISPLCKKLNAKPLAELSEFADAELA